MSLSTYEEICLVLDSQPKRIPRVQRVLGPGGKKTRVPDESSNTIFENWRKLAKFRGELYEMEEGNEEFGVEVHDEEKYYCEWIEDDENKAGQDTPNEDKIDIDNKPPEVREYEQQAKLWFNNLETDETSTFGYGLTNQTPGNKVKDNGSDDDDEGPWEDESFPLVSQVVWESNVIWDSEDLKLTKPESEWMPIGVGEDQVPSSMPPWAVQIPSITEADQQFGSQSQLSEADQQLDSQSQLSEADQQLDSQSQLSEADQQFDSQSQLSEADQQFGGQSQLDIWQ